MEAVAAAPPEARFCAGGAVVGARSRVRRFICLRVRAALLQIRQLCGQAGQQAFSSSYD